MPAIHSDWIASCAVVIGDNRRELLQGDVSRQFVPTIVVPGLRIERVVSAGTDGIIPLPGAEILTFGMIRQEHLGDTFRGALGFLINGKLIGVNSFVFMNAGFQVPAGKIAAVGAREGAGPKTADRRALPITVVDQVVQLGLACAGIGERLAHASLPGDSWNRVSRPQGKGTEGDKEKSGTLRKTEFHGASGVGDGWVRRVCVRSLQNRYCRLESSVWEEPFLRESGFDCRCSASIIRPASQLGQCMLARR